MKIGSRGGTGLGPTTIASQMDGSRLPSRGVTRKRYVPGSRARANEPLPATVVWLARGRQDGVDVASAQSTGTDSTVAAKSGRPSATAACPLTTCCTDGDVAPSTAGIG